MRAVLRAQCEAACRRAATYYAVRRVRMSARGLCRYVMACGKNAVIRVTFTRAEAVADEAIAEFYATLF